MGVLNEKRCKSGFAIPFFKKYIFAIFFFKKYNYMGNSIKIHHKEIKNNDSIKNNELLNKYICHIKNLKSFNKEILTDINNMSNEDRLEILITYNNMIEYIESLFDEKIIH